MIWIILAAAAVLVVMSQKTSTQTNAPTSTSDVQAIKDQIVSAATQYGIDPNLMLAVAQQESGFRQYDHNGNVLTSKAGALGVMQLEPATAQDLGVDPTDTTQNIDGGCRLMARLLGKYQGDTTLALAAYNAGPGNVDKYGGVPPFAETQAYVTAVLGYQSVFAGTGVQNV
jgi:soluble lytic murein transglycosylase-like protein